MIEELLGRALADVLASLERSGNGALARLSDDARAGSATGLRAICERVSADLPAPRLIRNAQKLPYLSRHYFMGGPVDADPWDRRGNPRRGIQWDDVPVNVYLHHLHCGDDGRELHNHPWSAALSLILAGGYDEDRRADNGVVRRAVAPLQLNLIKRSDFHRIEMVEDAWSLFITGPVVERGDWSYWNPETGKTMSWRERAYAR